MFATHPAPRMGRIRESEHYVMDRVHSPRAPWLLWAKWQRLRAAAYKRQDPATGYPLARWWARPCALPLSWLLARFGLSPHVVTALAVGVALLACLMFVTLPFPGGLIWGTVFLFGWYFLDHVDGQVARLQGCATPAGRYLDFWMHGLVHPLAALGVAVHAASAEPSLSLPCNPAFLFFVATLALEAHVTAESKAVPQRDHDRTPASVSEGRARPWRHLYRLCEFPNVLPQLAALGVAAALHRELARQAFHVWTVALGGIGLVLACVRVVVRIRRFSSTT